MPSYVPPKKNAAFVFYLSLPSQANAYVYQVNPTLAAGDVKVSIDGGTEANIATLPVVTPAGSKRVKVTLSAAEMNGDNIQVTFSDASGSEWCDVTVHIQTAARQLDDLARESGGKLETVETLASGASGFAALKGQTAAIEADTQDLQTQVGASGAGLTAIGDLRMKLLEADQVVDTGTDPWQLVWIEKGTGGLGVGVELMRKDIRDTAGTGITSTMVVPGRVVTP